MRTDGRLGPTRAAAAAIAALALRKKGRPAARASTLAKATARAGAPTRDSAAASSPSITWAAARGKDGGRPRGTAAATDEGLDVVVQRELVRMRPQPDGIHLGLALVVDPRLGKIR